MRGRIAAECKLGAGVALVCQMRSSPILPSGAGAVVLAATLGGCAMGGALHQATLTGQCATDDVACSRRHPQAPMLSPDGKHWWDGTAWQPMPTGVPQIRTDE